MCHLTRTIWPIGHGAFYTERFEDIDGKGTSFTAVYDCGAYQFGIRYEDILKSEIDKFLGRLRNNVIDVVFLSHFDKDHVNGFRYLLSKNVTIRNLIIPNLSNEQLVCALLKNVVEEEPLDEDIRWFFSLLSNMENRGDMRIVRIPDLRATTEHDEQIEHDILQIPNSILPKARFTLGRCRNGAPMWVYIPVHQSYNQTKSKRLYQQILQAIDDVPANATLNINNTGAKEIWYKGAKVTGYEISGGDIATLYYDGTRYNLLSTDGGSGKALIPGGKIWVE